jgi:hypothetical protein
MKTIWVVSGAVMVLVAVACAEPPPAETTEGDDTSATDPAHAGANAPPSPPAVPAPPGPPPAPANATCPYDGPPLIDVSKMPACRTGGRCVPAAAVPKDQQSQLATCDTGLCVAEDLVAYEGLKLLTSCHSLAGGEGRCMSRVFPAIDAEKDRLPQDACKETERCAPCFDPVSGAPTGVCSLISCDKAKEAPKVFASCCSQHGKMNGRCVPKSTMTPDEAKQLEQKECASASDVCAPADSMDPSKLPPKCTGSSILGGYDGVCISTCVPRDFFAQIGTSQGNCDGDHFCAPCSNPLTGAPTGAPGCGP